MERFPTVGVEVQTGNGEIRLLRANRYTQAHLADEQLGCILQPLDTLPGDWLKVVFAGDSALLEQIEQFAGQNSYPGVYFLRTNTIYYEIMPTGVNKATGLERLCARLAIPMENVIFIGDYYNDLDLMRMAGHSVAVANAPREVQMQADEVTLGRCADGTADEAVVDELAAGLDGSAQEGIRRAADLHAFLGIEAELFRLVGQMPELVRALYHGRDDVLLQQQLVREAVDVGEEQGLSAAGDVAQQQVSRGVELLFQQFFDLFRRHGESIAPYPFF